MHVTNVRQWTRYEVALCHLEVASLILDKKDLDRIDFLEELVERAHERICQ